MSALALKLRKPLAFLQRDLIIAASYRFQFFSQILVVVFAIFTLYFISKVFGAQPLPALSKYGGNYFAFAIIGFSFSSYLSTALNSLSKSIREAQMTGTLEPLLITQTSVTTLIVSSSLYSFLLTSLQVVLFLGIGAFAFGVDFSAANYGAAVVIFILTILSFSSLGIISAAFIMVFKRGNPVNWLFTSVSWLLGGVYYPVSVLPDWLQTISKFLPMTHALEGIRLALLQGASFSRLEESFFCLGLFTVVFLPASLLVFRWAVQQAKVHGSLTHY